MRFTVALFTLALAGSALCAPVPVPGVDSLPVEARSGIAAAAEKAVAAAVKDLSTPGLSAAAKLEKAGKDAALQLI
ncbi:hypothetical protein DFH06DRAFT_1313800 [Mycena polygramma]|nr:hypothetical protein DFH06DRAFT_1313800 [Mycena polygramma]